MIGLLVGLVLYLTSPTLATTTKFGKRVYEWRGQKYHSVTSILNAIGKPALVGWAKKFTAEYAVNNLEKLNVLLEPDTHGEVDREGAVSWLKDASFRSRDRAADIGNEVHGAIEAYVLGKPMPKWSPIVKPMMEQFESFLADYEPEYEQGMAEASVFNIKQRYAGTLDAIAIVGGRRYIIDLKTGKGVYPEVALQLAAYRHAEFIAGADGSEVPMPEIERAACLHIPQSGGYQFVEVRADDEIFQAFLYVREVFRWMEVTSKTVLQGDVQREEKE